jgi:hypothetical protein
MAKDQITEGLEDNQATGAVETAKEKKVQTAEDRELLVAGVAQMKKIGVSDELAKVLELVADWNGEEEAKTNAKAAVIASFEKSDNLKDYIDQKFAEDVKGFAGLAKVLPILNNIKSFYARREGKGKAKVVQMQISGKIYSVNASYVESIKDKTSEEKKQLILSHPDTKESSVIEVL